MARFEIFQDRRLDRLPVNESLGLTGKARSYTQRGHKKITDKTSGNDIVSGLPADITAITLEVLEQFEQELYGKNHPRFTRDYTPWSPDESTLLLYMHQIGPRPSRWLTIDECRTLGALKDKGKKAQEEATLANIGTHPLDDQQRRQVIADIRTGDKAKSILVYSCLYWVVNLAKKISGDTGLLADLVQEGNEGLLRAAEKYDPKKETKFSTYAEIWISSKMLRLLSANLSSFSLPHNLRVRFFQLHRIEDQLEQELGRPPTIEEVVACSQQKGKKAKKIDARLVAFPLQLSLDESVQDGGALYDELVTAPAEDEPYNEGRFLSSDVIKALDIISEKVPPIVVTSLDLFYGLSDGRERTMTEVATELGLNPDAQGIKQVQRYLNRGILALRGNKKLTLSLKDYLS